MASADYGTNNVNLSRRCGARVTDLGWGVSACEQLDQPDLFVWVVAYLVGTEATGIFIGLVQEMLIHEETTV